MEPPLGVPCPECYVARMLHGQGAFLGIFFLGVSSAGCGSLAPGGLAPAELAQGDDNTVENHSETVSLDAEVGNIGVPRERVEGLSGPWRCTLAWEPVSADTASFSATGETSLTVSLSIRGESAVHEWCTGHNAGSACPPDTVKVPVDLGLVTEDGVFDEALEVELVPESGRGWLSVIPEFDGSYDFAPTDPADGSIPHINLELDGEPEDPEITGEVLEEITRGTGAARGGVTITIGEIGCEAEQ
jgi:hypothetical protein